MKQILFFFLSFFLIQTGCNTSQNAVNSMTPEELSKLALNAINNNDFVLEANFIIPRSGASIYVSSNTNFISVKGDKATIQLTLSNQYAGPNGIGGITLDGTVSNKKISTDKNGNTMYSMNVQGVRLSATVTFNMTKDTNRCTATVTPNFSNNIISFSGYIYPTSMTNVYKGKAL